MLMGYGLYKDGHLEENLKLSEADIENQIGKDWSRASHPEDGAFIWLGLYEPDVAELAAVQRALNLPDLLIDDALNPSQRPSFDWHGESSGFIIVKILQYADETSDVFTGQLAIFFDHSHVVTVRHGGIGSLDEIRHRVDSDVAHTSLGPLSVIHAILDKIVDEYVSVANGVAEDIAEIEASVFSTSLKDESETIYRLKRENLEIRRAVFPLINAAEIFINKSSPSIPEELLPSFQDLGEHILRVHEQVENQDSLITSVMSASMARQSLRQNEDMRKISAWVAIAAMPTMIAGIYGMNFEHMPELGMRFGYAGALSLMGAVCFGLWRAFKKSGWL